MNPRVDFYFSKAGKWQDELAHLRIFVLDCGLTEELKWGVPCYTSQQRNIALIHVFKDYCALLFVKGALLKDPAGVLVQQTPNTQAARQLRFTSTPEILKLEPLLKAYLQEAIAAEEAGFKVPYKTTTETELPEELQRKMAETPGLKTAFAALTPGRQRAYLLHLSAPKQPKTREARVEKCTQQILAGKGLSE